MAARQYYFLVAEQAMEPSSGCTFLTLAPKYQVSGPRLTYFNLQTPFVSFMNIYGS